METPISQPDWQVPTWAKAECHVCKAQASHVMWYDYRTDTMRLTRAMHYACRAHLYTFATYVTTPIVATVRKIARPTPSKAR